MLETQWYMYREKIFWTKKECRGNEKYRHITSTIAIAIGPRHVYNVIHEGAKKKFVVNV